MPKRPKPKSRQTVNFQIDAKLLAKIDQIATANDRSRSSAMRALLAVAVERFAEAVA